MIVNGHQFTARFLDDLHALGVQQRSAVGRCNGTVVARELDVIHVFFASFFILACDCHIWIAVTAGFARGTACTASSHGRA